MKTLFYLFFLVLVLTSCGSSKTKEATYIEYTGEAQGTYFRIVAKKNDSVTLENIQKLLKDFDEIYSNYNPQSFISNYNNNALSVPNSSPAFNFFMKKSFEFYDLTNGAFDISCAPLVNAWKFGFKNDSLIPTQEKIDSLLQFVGMEKISRDTFSKQDQRIQIISNAIAQGYSVDLLGNYLEAKGVMNYLIDVGGEMKAKGVNPNGENWKVGINTPKEGVEYSDYSEVVELQNSALATSGNYRKFYELNGKKYSHTIDPRTGYPVRHNLLSATIITDLCIDADALATACMVIGLDSATSLIQSHDKYDALFIYEENGEMKTWKSF